MAPTDGVKLALPGLSLRAPKNWSLRPKLVSFHASVDNDKGIGLIGISDQDLPGLEKRPTLSRLAASSIKAGGWEETPTAQGEVAVGGVPLYHVAGRVSLFQYVDEYGGYSSRGHLVSVQVLSDLKLSKAARRQLVDSVLASLRWT